MKRLFSVVCGILLVGLANAQVVIQSISTNGVLSWNSSLTNATSYSVQWAPSLDGPWSSNWSSLSNIPPTNTSFTVSVPMFYRVVANVPPPPPAPCELPGDCCTNATAILSFPASLNGQSTVGYANDAGNGTGCVGAAGRDRFYSVIVPPGKRLFASVTSSSSYDPSINLQLDCGGNRVCIAGDDSGTAGTVNTVRYMNSSASPVSILVVVDSASATGAGTFDLFVSLDDVPNGDTCENPISISAGIYSGETTIGFANDSGAGNGCVGTAGADRFYQVLVPTGKRVTAAVTPYPGYNPSISLQTACAPRSCVASDDSGSASARNIVQYVNSSGAEMPVVIAIDSATANGAGNFDLEVTFADVPPGETCANSVMIGPGILSGQSTLGYSNDSGTGASCNGTAGPDRYYALELPVGKRLTATVTPTTSWDPSINLKIGCPSTSCLVGTDTGGTGQSDTVQYSNLTAATMTILIVIDTYLNNGTGGFTLTTSIGDAN